MNVTRGGLGQRGPRKRMTLSKIGRIVLALVASASLGLGMTACGGGTIGYMWVVGSYYNQITGFKIDNYTGNLTAIPHSPFTSGGSNPVTILVKPGGGRFVYVINTGSAAVAPGVVTATNPQGLATQVAPGNIAEYSVGGDGVLTYQQTFFSQGIRPTWATFDSTGNYLYVQDQYAPDTSLNGSITAFSVASDTGRLSLLTNAVNKIGSVNTSYFSVGVSPVMTKVGSGNCLFTLLPNAVFAYVIGANGQLTLAQTGAQIIGSGAGSLSSINTGTGTSGSAYTYITEKSTNMIYSESAGSSTSSACSLQTINQSQQTNLAGTANPVNSLTSQSGKFLYVVNQTSTTSTGTAAASISTFTIDGTGRLQVLADSSNPYSTGSGPICIVQDPSNQYLYTSNSGDNTVTGKIIDQNRGVLGLLSRGSVFPTTQTPTCLAVSGSL